MIIKYYHISDIVDGRFTNNDGDVDGGSEDFAETAN